jgi:hypothetical protein
MCPVGVSDIFRDWKLLSSLNTPQIAPVLSPNSCLVTHSLEKIQVLRCIHTCEIEIHCPSFILGLKNLSYSLQSVTPMKAFKAAI